MADEAKLSLLISACIVVVLVPVQSQQQTVHIVFMNHLDVGYNGIPTTGFINNILNIYFHEYFPRAMVVAASLRELGYRERFVYTTHPWLVSLYLNCPPHLTLSNITLKCPNASDVSAFKSAVKRGDITWHAGPMNMQPENMNRALFELGLNVSLDLDRMFDIKRQYATLSQRDVPGMTAAVIPSLVKYGVAAVSVGVNPGTSPPALPSPAVWTFQGKQVIALWNKGGYPLNPGPSPRDPGGLSRDNCAIVSGFDHVLCFAFRTDNSGPPVNMTEVLGYYEIMRKEFPGARLVASTFDAYVEALQSVRAKLPVVNSEVGDTWIQGVASDPYKMAKYWAFANSLQECMLSGECSGDDPRIKAAARFLIKAPEHTWGLPSVGDNINWSNSDFQKARSEASYGRCVSAWEEQREFVDLALAGLGDHPLVQQVKAAWDQQTPSLPHLADYKLVGNKTEVLSCEDGMQLQFGSTGALVQLYDPYNKMNWASESHPVGQMLYSTYNETDFDFMASLYDYFGGAGYDKPNSTKNAHPESRSWPYQLESLYKNTRSTSQCDLLVHIEVTDLRMAEYYGSPTEMWLHYTTRKPTSNGYPGGVDVSLQFYDKNPTRLAESLSYGFSPVLDSSHRWLVSKLGSLVDPGNVILNGSQYVHATDGAVYYIGQDGSGLQLLTSDAPLMYVATPSRPPSPFPVPLTPISQHDISGVAFNLYNNIWNTNYILWYPYASDRDASFKARFKINFYKP